MSAMAVGIVGCGRMGKERARASAACGARVAFVHDIDLERARAMAHQYDGCRVIENALDLVSRGPAAVFVCTPPGARGPVELAAIEAGIPFFVEKPIGVTATQVALVREKLLATNLIHGVGYHNRCRSSVERARDLLRGKTILAISAFWAGRKYLVPWWLLPEVSGGPINEQTTHLIDLCRFLGGEIVSADAIIDAVQGSPGEPFSAALNLRFASGAFGSLFYSCEANDKQIGIRVIAAEGGLTLSTWDLSLTQNDFDTIGTGTTQEDIFVRETQRFLGAIERATTSAAICTFEDAWRTQLAVDGIRTIRQNAGRSE